MGPPHAVSLAQIRRNRRPIPVIITSTVLCQVKDVQYIDVSLPAAGSQSQKTNHCHHVHAHIHQPVSSPLLNDRHIMSQPLHSQLTSAEPRPRSGKPARQPPRVTNQKTPASPSATAHTQPAKDGHMHQAYQKQMVLIPGGPSPSQVQYISVHSIPYDMLKPPSHQGNEQILVR